MRSSANKALAFTDPNFAIVAFGVILCLFLVLLLLTGHLIHLAILLGASLCVWFALRFPLGTVVGVLMTGVIPTIFQMTPVFYEEYGSLGWGLNAVDLVLVAMVGATVIHLLKPGSLKGNLALVYVLVIVLGIWFIFQILRNVPQYGLSAPGEFRYRYFILALPLYVVVFFDSADSRRRLWFLLIGSSLFIVFLALPIIGSLKGWGIGEENRFLPSAISLGVLYGAFLLYVGRKTGYTNVPPFVVIPALILACVVILVDGHRSVWLAAFVLLSTFVALKIPHLSRNSRLAGSFCLVILGCFFVTSVWNIDVFDFVLRRGVALVEPSADPTAQWRLVQWETQMQKFFDSPIWGEGFGGYWRVSDLREVSGISPHSLYVQSLVKVGLLGLLLYLIIMAKIFRAFVKWIKTAVVHKNRELPLVLGGLCILLAAHAFYFVYAFEYYSMLFVGLAGAVVRHSTIVSPKFGPEDGQKTNS